MDKKRLKPLYLTKSLSELNSRVDIEPIAVKYDPAMLIKSMKTILKEAKKLDAEGDEESAYILYMKFVGLYSKFAKRTENHKKELQDAFGKSTIITSYIDRIEEISKSLKERYEKQYGTISTEMPAKIIEPTIQPLSEEIPQEKNEFVSCKELNDMLTNGVQILIMDVRLREDFERTRIEYMYNISVPEEFNVIGYQPAHMTNKLPNESRVYWGLRKRRKMIIVDWESKSFERNSLAWNLREAIRLDPEQDYEDKTAYLLVGGYEEMRTKYPHRCIEPHYIRPKPSYEPDINAVDYDNIDISIGNGRIPKIDRSAKKNAVDNHEKNAQQLLEELSNITNTSLQNEKRMQSYEISNDLENEKENENEETKRKRFEFLELEAKQNDISLTELDLIAQLKHKKEKNIDKVELTKVELLEKQLDIQQKQAERDRLKREREKKEFNKKEFVEKRPRTVTIPPRPLQIRNSNEVVLTPRNLINNNIPAFDRSTKPRLIINEVINEDDFSPCKGRVDEGLCGLRNLGNTCYMNSIIQCISNTSILYNIFTSSECARNISHESPFRGRIARIMTSVIRMLWQGDNEYFSPRPLKNFAGEQDSLFLGEYQQDAHEFLILLIDWLQTDLQSIKMNPPMNAKLPASEKAWLEYTKGTESLIHRTFYGQIKSTLTCLSCRNESATYEAFSNLSLELPPDNIGRHNIDNCFYSYFTKEKIEGWTCEHCKCPRTAEKKLSIAKLPPVLVIHLKRFQKQDYSSACRKNNIYVDFPLTDLHMTTFVSVNERSSNPRFMYSLYGVSNHYGRTMESGHYTAFCKNFKKDRWYKFDDSTVSPLDASDVVSSAAYVLFYTNVPTSKY